MDFDTDFNRTKDNKLILKQDVFDGLKKNFAGRPAIVMQAGTFQQMLNEIKLEDYPEVIQRRNGFVKYRKGYSDLTESDFHVAGEDVIDIAFVKDNFFRAQHEYRLAFLCKSEMDINIQIPGYSEYCEVFPDISTMQNFTVVFE